MPPASWSLGLIGLGLFGALQGPPSAAAAGSEALANRAFIEPRQVEMTGGLRLLLAPPDNSGTVAACVGYVVGVAVSDPGKRAAAIADLELRRENISKIFRERLSGQASPSRILDILNGDVAVLCATAANDAWEAALSVAIEAIRPVTLTPSKWSSLVEQWRDHQGVASLVGQDPLQRQLQALTWLGAPDATASIRNSVEPSSLIRFDTVARASPAPQRFVVTVSGQYEPRSVEQWIRANQLIREHIKSHAGRALWLPAQAALPLRQNPRFAHERVPHSEGHAWLFSWPISHLDEGGAASFDAVAQLIERRLNRTSKLGKEGTICCELRQGRGFGSLVIELRSRTLVDLDTIEKWVYSTIEQLRTTPNEKNDLVQVAERISNQADSASHSAIERAWTMTQKALLLKGTPGTPKALPSLESEVARLIDRDLSRRSVAEIFAEAQDPLPPRTNGRNPTSSRNRQAANAIRPQGNRMTGNHRGGRIYVIQNGESLQTIARKFHVTIGEIIRENGLHHPDQIRPGARIVIPSPAATAK